MDQNVTISDLTPNLRGPLVLRFQVVYSLPSANNPQQISLKIADQTGCINAYFNYLGEHIKTGEVYQLHSFKCKVVEHSLRVELTKDSKINRIKYDMPFKDLVNNLSQKFYATKTQQQQTLEQSNPQPKETKGVIKASKEVPLNQPSLQEKGQENKEAEKIMEKKEQKTEKGKNEDDQNGHKSEKKVKKEYKEKKNNKEEVNPPKEESKPIKKKYVLKKTQALQQKTEPQAKQDKQEQYKRVLLKQIWQYREEDVNLFIQIDLKNLQTFPKYILVRGCDSSGSTCIQFDKRTHLQNKGWYCLRKFKVFGDKRYGYIASQQPYSTYELLDDYNEIPENRSIYFPKPK